MLTAESSRIRPRVRDGIPVAALDADEALAENPELVEAAGVATLLAVETGRLEGQLRASQARALAAADAERRRIGRDLHDSAQQRLVALRVHLSLAGEQLPLAGGGGDTRLPVEDAADGRFAHARLSSDVG